MELFKKYEFNSKEQAEQKIASLPHTDEWSVEPEYADKYSIDVLWNDLDESPYGWKSYEITVEGNGVHTFLGRNF
jgi:hypothetical protein